VRVNQLAVEREREETVFSLVVVVLHVSGFFSTLFFLYISIVYGHIYILKVLTHRSLSAS
jgi:hypothetical protein